MGVDMIDVVIYTFLYGLGFGLVLGFGVGCLGWVVKRFFVLVLDAVGNPPSAEITNIFYGEDDGYV